LTKDEEKERIIINRSGRATYPEQKSVLTSGATPEKPRLVDHDSAEILDLVVVFDPPPAGVEQK
jgi:hypothetical protein